MTPRIGILGGTGHIAQVLAPMLAREGEVLLYSRTPPASAMQENLRHLPLADFGKIPLDLAVNAIGVGDPRKIRAAGDEIHAVTRHFDSLVLEHLGHAVSSYVFLSSVAVYGEQVAFPVDPDSLKNASTPARSAYGAAKFEAEQRHERHGGPITDLRIFGFVSPLLPPEGGFLLTEIFRPLRNNVPFFPKGPDFYRDYIGPRSLADFLTSRLATGFLNQRIDAVSRQPLSRNTLLKDLRDWLGLEIREDHGVISPSLPPLPSASLMNSCFGRENSETSLENVQAALHAILSQKTP